MELIKPLKKRTYIETLDLYFYKNLSILIDNFITFSDKCKVYRIPFPSDDEREFYGCKYDVSKINICFKKQWNCDILKGGDVVTLYPDISFKHSLRSVCFDSGLKLNIFESVASACFFPFRGGT